MNTTTKLRAVWRSMPPAERANTILAALTLPLLLLAVLAAIPN